MKESIGLLILNDNEPDPLRVIQTMREVRDIVSPKNKGVIEDVIRKYAVENGIELPKEECKPTFSERLKNYISDIRNKNK